MECSLAKAESATCKARFATMPSTLAGQKSAEQHKSSMARASRGIYLRRELSPAWFERGHGLRGINKLDFVFVL